jgi:hypothetical protein
MNAQWDRGMYLRVGERLAEIRKSPLQLGELPIEPAEERLSSLRVALRRRRCHTNLAESRKCGLSQRRWS